MILAEDEVELGTDHSGIMLLNAEHEPGTPLADVLPLGDTVLEIETGYNRPDLTSVYGIAREVSALLDVPLAPMPGGQSPSHVPNDEAVDIRIDDLERCPRYIGRLFREVTVGDSPQWLKARLLAAGMRPISNVVDVTNYVMLALGNPLHAFDHDTLAGRVIVRRARRAERLVTLDGSERALEDYDLLIADEARAIALAGIMGGEETEIGDATTNVLLEAANFETYTPSLRPDNPDPNALRLTEPVSAELAILRTSLLPSLVDAVRHNADVGVDRIALFEVARVYLPTGGLPEERLHVCAIAEGGFFRAKGAVEALCRALKVEPGYERGTHELLHPGKTARLPWGVVGELHPRQLDGTWSAFELDFAQLAAASREPVTYEDVITYPPVRQDLAFSVPEEISAGELVAAAREAAGPELREMRAFDVYRGGQVGEGRKSIAFAVSFQSSERTLSDEDAARLREAIVAALRERFGAELRA